MVIGEGDFMEKRKLLRGAVALGSLASSRSVFAKIPGDENRSSIIRPHNEPVIWIDNIDNSLSESDRYKTLVFTSRAWKLWNIAPPEVQKNALKIYGP